jgi:hypothetical protein
MFSIWRAMLSKRLTPAAAAEQRDAPFEHSARELCGVLLAATDPPLARGLNRPVTCRNCGGTRIHAIYRASRTVYIGCDDCKTIWPLDTTVSETPLGVKKKNTEPRRDKRRS